MECYTRMQSIEVPGVDANGNVIWIPIKAPLDMKVHRMQFQGVLNTGSANPVEVYINTQSTPGDDNRGITLSLRDTAGLDLQSSEIFVLDGRGVGHYTDTYYVGSIKLATLVVVMEGTLKK